MANMVFARQIRDQGGSDGCLGIRSSADGLDLCVYIFVSKAGRAHAWRCWRRDEIVGAAAIGAQGGTFRVVWPEHGSEKRRKIFQTEQAGTVRSSNLGYVSGCVADLAVVSLEHNPCFALIGFGETFACSFDADRVGKHDETRAGAGV